MPITVGSQTDVPATGDPIVSPWHQDTATKIVHRFASDAARNAWTTRPEGAVAYVTATKVLSQWNGTAWVALSAKVSQGGDTMTGDLFVGGDPTSAAGIRNRAMGGFESTIIGTAGGGSGTLTWPNLQLIRAYSPSADVGGTFMTLKRSASGVGGAVQIGSITVATGGSGVLYNTSSDERLKDVVGDLDGVEAVGAVAALHPVRFTWKSDPDGNELSGFLAHEVADVIPEAVTGERGAVDADGNIAPQQLDRSALIPFLVAAIQTLNARIDALEAGP